MAVPSGWLSRRTPGDLSKHHFLRTERSENFLQHIEVFSPLKTLGGLCLHLRKLRPLCMILEKLHDFEINEQFSDAVDAKSASAHIDDMKVEKEYNSGRVQ